MNVVPPYFTSIIVEVDFSVRRSDKISPIFIILTVQFVKYGIEKKIGYKFQNNI